MKILIIEDEKHLAENMYSYLSSGDTVCETATTFLEAEDKIASFTYDVILLDIMLPDGSGLDLLDYIKKENTNTGILIISAKNALDDRIRGLELGADDYVTKPFHLSELNARVRAIYRRRQFEGQQLIQFGEISVNPETYEAFVDETLLNLTLKEYELLLYFIANKNRVLTKQSIAEHLWGDHIDSRDSFDFVYQHIKNLRKKITDAGGDDYINTIYGLGYKFTNKVR